MPKHGCFTPSRFADAMSDGSGYVGFHGTIENYNVYTLNGTVRIASHDNTFYRKVCEMGTRDFVAKEITKHLPEIKKKVIKEELIGETGPGETARGLAYEVAMERLGVKKPEITAPALEWGNEWEPLAIKRYSELTFTEVELVIQPFVHPDFDFVAGTPDGLIGTEGLIEVKCPYNPINHFMNLMDGRQIKQYNPQMQGYMWITGALWCDFVSFDPRYAGEMTLAIHRVERDQAFIDALQDRIIVLNQIAADLVARAKKQTT